MSNALAGITVIIADDSPVQRERNAAACVKYGMKLVGSYVTGAEAVAGAIKHKPQLVLLDIIMKDLVGTLAAKEIRAAKVQCKIVLITSTSQKDVVKTDLTMADAVLVKPFPDEWFLQKIYSVMFPAQAVAPVMKNDG